MTNYTKKAAKSTVIIFIATLAAAFFGYIVRIFFAKNLTIEEFGLFYSIIAFLGLFNIFKSLGVDKSLAYFIPKFNSEKNKKNADKAIGYSITILFATNIIFIIGIFLLSNFLGKYYFKNNDAQLILLIMAGGFFIDSFTNIIKYAAQGYQEMIPFSTLDLARMILIIIISYFAFKINHNIFGPVAAYAITPLLLLIFYYYIFFKKVFEFKIENFRFSKKLSYNLRNYGFQILLLYSGGIILSYSGTIILTYFRSLSEVGIYNAVYPLTLLLGYIPLTITNVLVPITSELKNKGMLNHLKDGIKIVYMYPFLFIIPASLLLGFFSKTIIFILFQPQYLSGSNTLKILAAGSVFYSLHVITYSILMGIGKPKLNTKIVISGGIINIILSLALIPKLGFFGAAVATSSSYILMSIMGILIIRKYINIKMPYIQWFKITISSLISLLAISFLSKKILLALIPKTFVLLIIFSVIYAIIILFMRTLSIEEIKNLMKRFKKDIKT